MDCDELKQIFMWDPFLTDQCKCKLKFGMGSNVTQVWYSVLAREPVQQDGATFCFVLCFYCYCLFFWVGGLSFNLPFKQGYFSFSQRLWKEKRDIWQRVFNLVKNWINICISTNKFWDSKKDSILESGVLTTNFKF